MQTRYISVAISLCLLLVLLPAYLPQEMQPLNQGNGPNSWVSQGRYSIAPAHSSPAIKVASLKHILSSPPKDESNTNITRAQFEEARAKWLARGVREYETVVDFEAMGGGIWKLRVRVDGGKPNVIRVRWINEDGDEEPSPYELTPDYVEYLTSFTVEGTFARVESVLDNELRGDDYLPYFEVMFNPELGYVTYLLSAVIPADNLPPPHDSATLLTVKSLRILKSTMPGMPRSGNPGP
jgi:hypothetical protein